MLASPLKHPLAEECTASRKQRSGCRQRGCVRERRACRKRGAASERKEREVAAHDRQQKSDRASRQRGTVLTPSVICLLPLWRLASAENWRTLERRSRLPSASALAPHCHHVTVAAWRRTRRDDHTCAAQCGCQGEHSPEGVGDDEQQTNELHTHAHARADGQWREDASEAPTLPTRLLSCTACAHGTSESCVSCLLLLLSALCLSCRGFECVSLS